MSDILGSRRPRLSSGKAHWTLHRIAIVWRIVLRKLRLLLPLHRRWPACVTTKGKWEESITQVSLGVEGERDTQNFSLWPLGLKAAMDRPRSLTASSSPYGGSAKAMERGYSSQFCYGTSKERNAHENHTNRYFRVFAHSIRFWC
jgi:hypothetical protein